mmetsp:Transcript_9878/g.17200  ORF Transcript_9878/g.17200 Transcript_9878/m.17200 type:complete len:238 (+) Transcript_9878:788-1501(+)
MWRSMSRWRGADLMMSSTRRIISAASVAEMRTCSLTLNDSVMPSSTMSPRHPRCMSSPAVVLWFACAARSWVTSSEASKPPLSAMMVGSCRRARAYASMASAFFPAVSWASWSTAWAHSISLAPPPYTIRVSFTAVSSTHRASCRLRSASSRTCWLAPRSTIVHASPAATPEKRMSLSSPMMTSSMSLQCPSFVFPGSSNVEAISAPRTAARRSMPSKSACSMAMTPWSAKYCSGKL